MKFYSEVLNKFYDDAEALKKDEDAYSKELTEKSASKKELAKNIESLQSAVEEAYDAYEVKKEEAAKILEESNMKVEELLKEGKDLIYKSESDLVEAIREFNKKFGTYTTSYKGDRAEKEFNRMMDRLNSTSPFFWF